MGKNRNKVMSVNDHQNKTVANKIRLEETDQLHPNSNEICTSSKPSSFVKFCMENNVIGCDDKNMQIFKRLSETGRQILLFRKINSRIGINLYLLDFIVTNVIKPFI